MPSGHGACRFQSITITSSGAPVAVVFSALFSASVALACPDGLGFLKKSRTLGPVSLALLAPCRGLGLAFGLDAAAEDEACAAAVVACCAELGDIAAKTAARSSGWG